MNRPFIRTCLLTLLVLAWIPSIAWAASIVIDVDKGITVPLSLVIISTIICTLSGATSLVFRLNKELRVDPPKPLTYPWLFCWAHMLGSWLAGTTGFFIGQASSYFDVWMRLVVIILMSFGGAKVIEKMAERFIDKLPLPGIDEKATP